MSWRMRIYGAIENVAAFVGFAVGLLLVDEAAPGPAPTIGVALVAGIAVHALSTRVLERRWPLQPHRAATGEDVTPITPLLAAACGLGVSIAVLIAIAFLHLYADPAVTHEAMLRNLLLSLGITWAGATTIGLLAPARRVHNPAGDGAYRPEDSPRIRWP